MDFHQILPILLGTAWLLPLLSFALIFLFGPKMGKAGHCAGYVATSAIILGFVLSFFAMCGWLMHHPLESAHHGGHGGAHATQDKGHHGDAGQHGHAEHKHDAHAKDAHREHAHPEHGGHAATEHHAEEHDGEHAGDAHAGHTPKTEHKHDPVTGVWYLLGSFGSLSIGIGYYIDSLTIAMFCMVTLIASCIHIYSMGYMHEELEDVTDSLVTCSDGKPLTRPGRYHRFFQYLSLFCFSMLGLVIAGNIAMVFVFWELVGLCSYLLIGFYVERKSASNAANKAFIVNRVGDFGMIIGLMAVWTGMGTFSFGDITDANGNIKPGMFSQVRPLENDRKIQAPDGMVRISARKEVAQIVLEQETAVREELVDGRLRELPGDADASMNERMQLEIDQRVEASIAAQIPKWREQGYGYWLLVIGGIGIFCGCVGKSAQFPLHTWLPDAMEGPTPVSALVHSATMVAAGVYLVGRFYPVFAPEALLVVAYTGCITLFLAATIAITATDIKRVLAYSTISQLGYMMLALGLGGWVAGMFHLFTHAFFKSLLFLCSGSVIHACHTNEMPEMGGLLKKMPYTGWTMLVGCLAIAGAGIPGIIGFSGYYSKDAIIAQGLAFNGANPLHGWMFYAAVLGAAITSFYMFRLWYMTFIGKPRDHHVYEHAHESPRTMTMPLVILAVFAVCVAWNIPGTDIGLQPMIQQSQPLGATDGIDDAIMLEQLSHPGEHESHAPEVHSVAGLCAFLAAAVGFVFATLFYGLRKLDPEDARRTFAPIHWFLLNKWWFDELYHFLFIRPTLVVSKWVSAVDRKGIDWVADNTARLTVAVSRIDDWIDRLFVDRLINLVAAWTFATGLKLRRVQTGNLRQYVMWIAVGAVALFVLISLCWSYAFNGA